MKGRLFFKKAAILLIGMGVLAGTAIAGSESESHHNDRLSQNIVSANK
jgi:hypothetical protein